ncbi:hypothetical protein D9619_001835 [Psilocybe cf. subviscida]|uniref:Uncharacterized protein n=1 Tax=Psilocybe cf. subviscida TaxID=2480587 RepID=A0A8H5BES1_9AGAR|nr:hypothetical protein D9619_001835 [Psilocybe cf. subviscida]
MRNEQISERLYYFARLLTVDSCPLLLGHAPRDTNILLVLHSQAIVRRCIDGHCHLCTHTKYLDLSCYATIKHTVAQHDIHYFEGSFLKTAASVTPPPLARTSASCLFVIPTQTPPRMLTMPRPIPTSIQLLLLSCILRLQHRLFDAWLKLTMPAIKSESPLLVPPRQPRCDDRDGADL